MFILSSITTYYHCTVQHCETSAVLYEHSITWYFSTKCRDKRRVAWNPTWTRANRDADRDSRAAAGGVLVLVHDSGQARPFLSFSDNFPFFSCCCAERLISDDRSSIGNVCNNFHISNQQKLSKTFQNWTISMWSSFNLASVQFSSRTLFIWIVDEKN